MQQSYPSTAYWFRREVMQPGDVISVQFHKCASRHFTPRVVGNPSVTRPKRPTADANSLTKGNPCCYWQNESMAEASSTGFSRKIKWPESS